MTNVIDLQSTLVRLGFDQELLGEMATLYREDAPIRYHQLRVAFANHDWAGVRTAAHALKGMAANFGAVRAVRAAADVEYMAVEPEWMSLLRAVDELRDSVEEVLTALAHYEARN